VSERKRILRKSDELGHGDGVVCTSAAILPTRRGQG
jgi:hypothetical protein